jgi:gamma-glutamylcyclotransferase (GGCT)/AIG2-like uncharacterized protein YtfP
VSEPHRFRLFVYGTLLEGEPDHGLLGGSRSLGPVATAAGYRLVELGPLAGMLEGGDELVHGELYEVVYDTLAACDKLRDHPRLFHRKTVKLADGSAAESYLMHPDQVRGRRRVRGGDWRSRFGARRAGELSEPGPFVSWTRARFGR